MSGPEGLLWGQGDSQVVVVNKTKERVGLALWNEMPERAIIRVVHCGSAAAEAGLVAFDEILLINGEFCESAVQAVAAIRDAPLGEELRLKILPCPTRLLKAAVTVQGAWLRALFDKRSLVRARLHKPELNSRLGIAFSPDFPRHAIVSNVSREGLAFGAISVGDRIMSVEGNPTPSAAAATWTVKGGAIIILAFPCLA